LEKHGLLEILRRVKDGLLSVEEAMEAIGGEQLIWLGHSCLDLGRRERSGCGEAVFAKGKEDYHLLEVVRAFISRTGDVLVTKLSGSQVNLLEESFPELTISRDGGVAYLRKESRESLLGSVAVVSAGTGDHSVSAEAVACAEYYGLNVCKICDVGVAGLPRLFARLEDIQRQDVVIVIAGMDGVLPSVVNGLVESPVIAVPTSVGYGASFEEIAALLGMLTSCSPGMTVVNIDNGFGAVAAALRIIRHFRSP